MANLDDELSLSFDGDSLDGYGSASDSYHDESGRLQHSTSGLLGSCTSLMNTLNTETERFYNESG